MLATTCTSYVHKYPAPVQMVKVNPERPVLSCSEELIYRNMPMNPDSNMEEYGGIIMPAEQRRDHGNVERVSQSEREPII